MRLRRLRARYFFRRCILSLLLPLPEKYGQSSASFPLQRPALSPVSACALAMVVSSLTRPGRDAPIPSDDLLGWILASVSTLSETDAEAAPAFGPDIRGPILHGPRCLDDSAPQPTCPANQTRDPSSFLSTIAALRRLRPRVGAN